MYLQILNTNVRLLGSIHLFPKSAPILPKWVMEAYEWADVLAFECDLNPDIVLPFFMSSESTKLKSMLAPDVWEKLESIWPTEGPLFPLTSVLPWAVLINAPILCTDMSMGVDPQLLCRTTEEQKPHRFLETPREMATTLGTVPIEEILAGLQIVVSDLTAPQRFLNDIHAKWLTRDLADTYLTVNRDPMFALPGFRNAVLESRNRTWAPIIKQMLITERRTLIVVGALHLYGPNNLVELLGRETEIVSTIG